MKLPALLPFVAATLLAAQLARAQGTPPREGAPAARVQGGNLERPQLPDLPAVPPAVLKTWADKTANILKMDGEIRRIEYEGVFTVEMHSEGKFYYEQPDKGRMDLKGLKFAPGKMGGKYKLENGKTEEWICDGERIFQINREADQPEANVFPIPEEQRGQNIMNGPLPFLFGMPPDVAQKRYWLFLKKHDKDTAYILAYPKWAADAQQYLFAEIILAKETYLPIAVKLRNPADTGDTVYTFKNLVQNRRFNFLGGDPFVPDLDGLKIVNKLANPPVAQAGPPRMPSLIGAHGSKVVEYCKALGLKPKFLRGSPADNEKLKHHVYEQNPPAQTPLKEGQTIEVTLYDAPAKG